MIDNPTDNVLIVSVTISSGASLSSIAVAQWGHLIRIIMPSWTAAPLTFQTSHDGSFFQNAYDLSGETAIATAAASVNITVPPLMLGRVAALKVRSGTSGSAVNQGADRVLTLVFSRYV
jgi:hypothetical protein